MQEKRKKLIFKSLKQLTMASVLVAISIICGKFLAINIGVAMRISFENMPIIFASVTMGPIIGTMVGVASDLIGCVLYGYAINPIITIGAGVIGFISGFVFKYIKIKGERLRLLLACLLSHTVGSVIIKTIGLASYAELPIHLLVIFRSLIYVVTIALEFIIIFYLLGSKSLRRQILEMTGEARCGNEMTYEEAINYIHSVNWTFCKPGLERISELCDKLGNPQKSLKFVHVAGTNGKGSFCSMLSSVLKEQGYKTGIFTSPYIRDFRERISINGEMISKNELSKITESVKKIADTMDDKPTEFEIITAIGFKYFANQKCDYVVLECGLGGRLDSTNIIESSVLSVITGISLDHTSILGDTVSKIAKEKAGIIKSNVPVLWCGESKEAFDEIELAAKNNGSVLYTVDRRSLKVKKQTLDGTIFDYGEFEGLEIKLLGDYQIVNAVNVLNAINILRNQNIEISDGAVFEGMKNAIWHARFEIISNDPLIIFDGGHNPEGVLATINGIKRYFGDTKLYVITGVMADKDYDFIASKISEVSEKVFCLTPNNPRALPADKYAKVFTEKCVDSVACSSIEEAVSSAVNEAKEKGKSILCIGSLYMYSDLIGLVE